MCPTCYGKIRHRFEPNPDDRGRRAERVAVSGDVHDRARALNERVRRGEIPMSHVALAAELAGRRDAALLDPGPFDFEYINAERRAFVLWAFRLYEMFPVPRAGVSRRSHAARAKAIREARMVVDWLEDKGLEVLLDSAVSGALDTRKRRASKRISL